MKIITAIKEIEKQIGNPGRGLPEDVFLFVSGMTPLVNVDLLIRDKKGRALLAWRDDKYSGTGWHVPGGIIRHREKAGQRIKLTAAKEIGAPVRYDKKPVAINEIILKQKQRAHFISLLYKCRVREGFVPENKGLCPGRPGYLKWHKKCPRNLIKVQSMYRKYINQGTKK